MFENLNPSNITVTALTAVAAQSDPSNSQPRLKSHLIGLSISNSGAFSARGTDLANLEDAMVERTRHLLAQGASLAYGEDL